MLRADRLTAIDSSRPACRQRPQVATASASTAVVSGLISPLRSARAMNSSGNSSPRTGCRQRTRASTPITCRCPAAPSAGVQLELATGDAVPQLADQRQPLRAGRGVQAGVVQVRAAAAGLRLVHRGVGALDQQVAVHAVHRRVAIPTDRPTSISTPHRDRVLERLLQAAGGAQRAGPAGDPGQQDGELVAAEAGQCVLLAERSGQAVADVAQQQVTERGARGCR